MTVKILAKRYEDLYRIAQDTTLESMEPMGIHDPESERMDDLKTKLLFSIIVLAFRVTFRHRVELWTRVRVMLQVREGYKIQYFSRVFSVKGEEDYRCSSTFELDCEQLPVIPSYGSKGNENQMNPPCAAVENSLHDYLERTVDHFDLSVCSQVSIR